MPRRRGLQADVLVSLSIVMVASTVVLGAGLVRTHQVGVDQLRRLAARGLRAEAELRVLPGELGSAVEWWVVERSGRIRSSEDTAPIDEPSRALAEEVRRSGQPVLVAGPPWEPARFATRLPGEESVAVARLPAALSAGRTLALFAAGIGVFTLFGAYLLRRRVVVPLQRLAAAARAISNGDAGARVPVEGVAETAEVALAFNEMTDALEGRTNALEKAVVGLRTSNRELRDARAGLDRAERLAAVGRLAAGVAHEVGNPLGAILAFIDLARRDAGMSDASRESLQRAARQGERVREILRQLLDFSRPARSARGPLDLAGVCEEAAALVRAQRRFAAVELGVCSVGDPPQAHADAAIVSQIVLNLLLNAADAVADGRPDPRITVEIRPAVMAVRSTDDSVAAPARSVFDAIECAVVDNGPGVAPEDRERVFSLFYTTKAPGEGTGLGLANALRLAEEMGGRLDLDAEGPEQGARFVLTLPAVGAASEVEAATPAARSAGSHPGRGDGAVDRRLK